MGETGKCHMMNPAFLRFCFQFSIARKNPKIGFFGLFLLEFSDFS
jgi:hypothetical protein